MTTNDLETKRLELEMTESNKMLEAMQAYAKMIFSSLVMTNGGAIIALLTFLGNVKYIQCFSDLWIWAMSLFCLGLTFALSSMVCAFWSQKLFREGKDKDIKHGTESNYTIKTNSGLQIRICCIFFGVSSITLFSIGAIFAISALKASFGTCSYSILLPI